MSKRNGLLTSHQLKVLLPPCSEWEVEGTPIPRYISTVHPNASGSKESIDEKHLDENLTSYSISDLVMKYVGLIIIYRH